MKENDEMGHFAERGDSAHDTISDKADAFDLERLRLPQHFGEGLGLKKASPKVPVRKPSKEQWFRVHPSLDYRLTTYVLELKEDREFYLLSPHLWSELSSESTISPRELVTAIDSRGTLFIWPLRLPRTDGKLDEWSRTALEAAALATEKWVRMQSNMRLSCYENSTSDMTRIPPWPDQPFDELIRSAFRNRMINSLDHAVLKQLRGEE